MCVLHVHTLFPLYLTLTHPPSLFNCSAAMVFVLSVLFLKERVTVSKVIAVSCCVFGIGLLAIDAMYSSKGEVSEGTRVLCACECTFVCPCIHIICTCVCVCVCVHCGHCIKID
jgi:hypothetical protein